jgi:hypothetical protein
MATVNPKSDVGAKIAFKHELERRGYTEVRVIGTPADIRARRDGQEYLFEIKATSKSSSYFGAATITEWEAALRAPDYFRFVIARQNGELWQFREYTPEEFIQYSDIPPFKVYFRIPLIDTPKRDTVKRRKAVSATLENLRHMIEFRAKLKDEHDKRT